MKCFNSLIIVVKQGGPVVPIKEDLTQEAQFCLVVHKMHLESLDLGRRLASVSKIKVHLFKGPADGQE